MKKLFTITIKRNELSKRRAAELFMDSRYKARVVKDKTKYSRKVKFKKDL